MYSSNWQVERDQVLLIHRSQIITQPKLLTMVEFTIIMIVLESILVLFMLSLVVKDLSKVIFQLTTKKKLLSLMLKIVLWNYSKVEKWATHSAILSRINIAMLSQLAHKPMMMIWLVTHLKQIYILKYQTLLGVHLLTHIKPPLFILLCRQLYQPKTELDLKDENENK